MPSEADRWQTGPLRNTTGHPDGATGAVTGGVEGNAAAGGDRPAEALHPAGQAHPNGQPRAQGELQAAGEDELQASMVTGAG